MSEEQAHEEHLEDLRHTLASFVSLILFVGGTGYFLSFL